MSVVCAIATDGFHFRFFRLDEDRVLQQSKELSIADRKKDALVFAFIDLILKTAVVASLHTTRTEVLPTVFG